LDHGSSPFTSGRAAETFELSDQNDEKGEDVWDDTFNRVIFSQAVTIKRLATFVFCGEK
jgi:hypothetical protein